jgi:hypothetical protein
MSAPIDTIYAKNGNVGIGIKNPVSALDVNGNICITQGTNYGIYFGDPVPNETYCKCGIAGEDDGSKLSFMTNGTYKMWIDSNGNLGIGTNNPENLLHVNGGVTIGATNGAQLVMDKNEINCTNGLHLQYSYSGNLSLCNGGGTVAIGTTPPTNSERLHVHGNVYATGFIIMLELMQIY